METKEEDKVQNFKKLDELQFEQNIDRIIPYHVDDTNSSFLVASYTLNKETLTKTGDIKIIEISDDKR